MNRTNAMAESTRAAATSPAATPQTAAAGADERLCHLFRATLRHGCIHPLYLPMLKYRQQCRIAGQAA